MKMIDQLDTKTFAKQGKSLENDIYLTQTIHFVKRL